jgi:NtrC-family two-component system response regulator AlgB
MAWRRARRISAGIGLLRQDRTWDERPPASPTSPSGGALLDAQVVLLDSTTNAMHRAVATARQAATSDVPVLVNGEIGTGKSLLAAAIHGWSPRRAGPFVTLGGLVVPGGTPIAERIDALVASFARETPVARHDTRLGTLFLDEIGDLSLDHQAELIRLLGDRHVAWMDGAGANAFDGRIVASTDRDLEAEVRVGRFRRDLFFRLSVVTVVLPPLRERPEDLPVLTDRLLDELAVRHGRAPLGLTAKARRVLAGYRWPGNVRELANVLERAVVLATGSTITTTELPDGLVTGHGRTQPGGSLREIERQYVRRALAESPTLGEAAAKLGINRTSLWRKRKRWGLE